MAIKVNFEKTYDFLPWDFIFWHFSVSWLASWVYPGYNRVHHLNFDAAFVEQRSHRKFYSFERHKTKWSYFPSYFCLIYQKTKAWYLQSSAGRKVEAYQAHP